MSRLVLAAVVAAWLTGCTDLSQRWELDHARVLAVRLSEPGLAAGERAAVDALVVDDAGVLDVAIPTTLAPNSSDPSVAAAVTVELTDSGWYVIAGDAAAIAGARTAAGLADDEPLDVQLTAQFTIGDHTLIALKNVRLGTAGANPASPTILIDGVEAGEPTPVGVDRPIALSLSGAGEDEELEFDWLTSTGTLERSETRAATLELAADDPTTGNLVCLVRHPDGGAAWATAAIAVE